MGKVIMPKKAFKPVIFRARLNMLIERNGITQKELAKKIDVSDSYISGLRTGLTEGPSVEVLCRLCVAFDVSPAYLTGFES
jgi:transcriptional regulator with XRE-family HTH domain